MKIFFDCHREFEGKNYVRSFRSWSIILPLLFSLLYGGAHSIHWISGLWKEHRSRGEYVHVPIHYGVTNNSDDYFYFARIRDMIDGRLLSFDPINYENRSHADLYASYHLSYILGAVGGWLTGKTDHAYYFDSFVYPALNFFLSYLILQRVTQSLFLSIFFALISVLFGMFYVQHDGFFRVMPAKGTSLFRQIIEGLQYSFPNLLGFTEIQRTPNIRITNVQLLLFAYLLLLSIENRARSIYFWICLALSLAASSLMSTANFVTSYMVHFSVMLFYWKQWSRLKPLVYALLLATVVSMPGVFVLFRSFGEMQNYLTICDQSALPDNLWQFDRTFWRECFYVAAPMGLFAFLRPAHWRYVLGGLIGCFVAYLAVTLKSGTFFGETLIGRGSEVLISMLLMTGLGSWFAPRWQRASMVAKRIFSLGALGFSCLLIGAVLINRSYALQDSPPLVGHSAKFAELCEWTRKSPFKDSVVLTFDPDLLMNLPACSPWYLYIPQALISSTTTTERINRFYQVASWYGLSVEDVERIADGMLPNRYVHSKDFNERLRSHWQLILYYGQFEPNPISKAGTEELIQGYKTCLRGDQRLSFKADYLIVSKFDESWIRSGSRAARLISSGKAVFQNEQYRVYRLVTNSISN